MIRITLLGVCVWAAPAALAGAAEVPAPVDALMRSDKECIDYDASHMKESRVTASLDKNATLYLLPCYTGAYNVIYRVFAYDSRYPDELKASMFAGYSDELGWSGKDYLINADFDPRTGRLTAFEKGRGLGDCGSQPTYQWAGYGWRMLEYRYWGECDGTRMPADWPVIFSYKTPPG